MQAAIRCSSIFVAGILAATLLHPAVAAQSLSVGQAREPVAFSFRFSRQQLGTQGGAERVYKALVRQAARACTTPVLGSAHLRYKDEECVAGLVDKTVRKIGAELLTALWQRSQPGRSAGAPASVQQPVAFR
jgi:UrcA family protein